MSSRLLVGLAGVALLVAGFVVLMLNTSVTNPNGYGQLGCGSALSSNVDRLTYDANVDGMTDEILGVPTAATPMAGVRACEDALSTRHVVGWPLGGIGVLALVGAVLMNRRRVPGTPTAA